MKKYKHFFKTNLFLTLFLSGIFLISCNNSVREYFEYYTDSAAIELMNLENVNGTSPSGFKSIDSNYDGNAEFILRNPKKYTLEMNFYATGKFEEALTLTSYYDQNGNWTVTQNASDPNIAQLWINKNLLKYIDEGNLKDSSENIIKAITGVITIEDSETHRPFESYDINILVNSPPPVIRNAMFQLTASTDGEYVLCFYLPKVKGTVHECDTKKIKIGSETYYFKDTGSGVNFYTDEGCTTSADSNKITTSYTNLLYPLTDDGLTFTAPASDFYPVYFLTGIQFSTNEVKYDIVLEDDFGFASSVGISNKGEKLTAVNIPDETSYFGTDDGYYEIQLTHNGKTITNNTVSGVTIYYTVEQGGSVVASGSGASGVKVKLPSGKKNYKIKAVARKPYYVESDEESKSGINVQRSTIYYVSQNGKSPENGALGTKASPFRTIQQAVNDITTQVDVEGFAVVTDGYTINLLSNITPDESDTFNHSALVCITNSYKYTINGNGHTIDANKKGRVIYVGGSTSITIENAILTGGNIAGHGGAIYFCSHEKLILKNVEIKNNKAGYGAGIQLDTACDFISGSIHDNEATSGVAVYIENIGTLSLGDNSNLSSIVNIYNNYNNNKETGSICVYGALTINQAKIFDNFIKASVSNPDIPNNVYLQPGRTINVGGDLSGCTIGVTTADSPSSGNTIQITTGYSSKNNLPPSKIFKSDAEGYGVITGGTNNNEAVLAVGGGSIDVPSQIYDNVKLILSSNMYIPGEQKNISITAKATVNGSANTDVTNSVTINSTKLYCHSEEVPSSYYSVSGKNITLNSSLAEDCYSLVIQFEYNGHTYGTTLEIVPDDIQYYSKLPVTPCVLRASTKDSLKKISQFSQDNTFEDIEICILNDIFLDSPWTPIGTSSKKFKGKINGNNHTISGLSEEAFIAYADNAEIENLTVSGNTSKAGLVTEIDGGKITNCVSNVTVNSSSDNAGGIVGSAKNGTIIKFCENHGNVTIDNAFRTGGIVGYLDNTVVIDTCINTGTISGASSGTSEQYIGGISGQSCGKIINCVNKGSVSGYAFIGGITGEINPTTVQGVENCINYGDISCRDSYAGGIAGGIGYWITGAYIRNCVNLGNVTGTTSGKILGYIYRDIENDEIIDIKYNYFIADSGAVSEINKAIGYQEGSTLSIPTVIPMNFSYQTYDSISIDSSSSKDLITLLNAYAGSTYKQWEINNIGEPALKN